MHLMVPLRVCMWCLSLWLLCILRLTPVSWCCVMISTVSVSSSRFERFVQSVATAGATGRFFGTDGVLRCCAADVD